MPHQQKVHQEAPLLRSGPHKFKFQKFEMMAFHGVFPWLKDLMTLHGIYLFPLLEDLMALHGFYLFPLLEDLMAFHGIYFFPLFLKCKGLFKGPHGE